MDTYARKYPRPIALRPKELTAENEEVRYELLSIKTYWKGKK
jgi:hypothetical protein